MASSTPLEFPLNLEIILTSLHPMHLTAKVVFIFDLMVFHSYDITHHRQYESDQSGASLKTKGHLIQLNCCAS